MHALEFFVEFSGHTNVVNDNIMGIWPILFFLAGQLKQLFLGSI